jgi:AraC-like DNA-binding protein
MPKTNMGKTEAQRIDDRYARLRRCIADQLSTTKHRERLTAAQMSKRLGMSHDTFAKLLNGEDVKVSTTTWLRILDMAYIVMKKRSDELEENR